MKRILSVLFVLSIVFVLLTGCQGKPAPTNAPPQQHKAENMKIGVLLSGEDMTVCQGIKSDFDDTFKSAGAEMVFMSEADAQKQVEAVDKLLGESINLLIIQPAHNIKMTDIAAKCKEKNVKIISFLRLPNAPVDLVVLPDYKKAGSMMAKYVADETVGKAQILVLEDEPGSIVSKDFLIGCTMTLREYNDVTLIKTSDIPEVSSMNPIQKLEAVLKKGNPAGVLCVSDTTAAEAADVLKKHNIADKVMLTGVGATTANLRLIFQGAQTADVYPRYDVIAKTAANAALTLLKKGKPDGVKSLEIGGTKIDAIITDVEIVNSDNLKNFLAKVKVYNSDEIFRYAETGTPSEGTPTPADGTSTASPKPEAAVPEGEMTPHWVKTDSPPEVKPDEESGKKPAKIESTHESHKAKPGEHKKTEPVIRPGITPAPSETHKEEVKTHKEAGKKHGEKIPMPNEKKNMVESGSPGGSSESPHVNSSEKTGLEKEINPSVDVTKPGSIR